ncbi:glycosyltransferase family 4 protein [Paucisalibacillus globulus]|uniref:glycosyltransferase family 4 protein n=1 Tax=Paucisalibacillus globulus TaxID=351095 RepID=UPI000BB67944|nr:glycosyltransferase family 4 protein [Paucisalibacillus globulus]
MHILIPVYFNADMGGLHLNVFSTALYLKNNNHEVTVLCKNGVFSKKLIENDIRVIETDFDITSYKETLLKIVRLHNDNPIDIIHTHPFKARKISLAISRLLNRPLFLTIHGRYTDDLPLYLDKVSMVFTVSEGIKDYIFDKTKTKDKYKFAVIPNGVDVKLFEPPLRKYQNNNQEEKSNGEEVKIAFVSRLDKDKQFIIDVFYRALEFTYNKYGTNVKWKIVGDGTEKDTMKDKISSLISDENYVDFVGWKNDIQLYQEYSESNIVIAPGRSALEGLSCGKPVIAIGSKGYVGLINHDNWLKGVYSNFGGIGDKIKSYDEGSIEKDLETILDNKPLRLELSELGINLIQQYYNEDTINKRLMSFYTIFKLSNNKIDKINSSRVMELIECQVSDIKIEKLSDSEFAANINCYESNINPEFAWYIYHNDKLIEKFMYSNSNSITYTIKESGSYQVQAFIKNGNDKFSFLFDRITF